MQPSTIHATTPATTSQNTLPPPATTLAPNTTVHHPAHPTTPETALPPPATTLGAYIPKRLSHLASPTDNAYTRQILELKWRHKSAHDYFFAQLNPILPANARLCIVPSHNHRRLNPGIRILAIRLAHEHQRTDLTHILQRITTTPEMRTGTPRSESLHFSTIQVTDPAAIKDQHLILLDDVISSGCSMRACKTLLLAAGAQSVQCIALAQTIKGGF